MKKSQTLAILLLLSTIPCLMLAQKKELSQARTILKSGKNVGQAEQLMVNLLKDSANHNDKNIYAVWYQAVQKQYEAANERLYLKQQQDTAQFFDLVHRMFSICETLDSLDSQPDKKGRTKPSYRTRHAEDLNGYRGNLFFGGTYYLRKQQYQKAFDFFQTYIDCAEQPLFQTYRYDSTDTRLPQAAYWAMTCGYKLQDPLLTLRHRTLAYRDTAHLDYAFQYTAEAWSWLKDDSLYHSTLVKGFNNNPRLSYFLTRLVDYYNARAQYEQALQVSEQALRADSVNELALYAKSNALLSLKRYGESVKVSLRLSEVNPTLPEPYYNAGMAYLNLALKLDPRKDKKQLKGLYQKACTSMEKYRELAPAQKQKWGPALYRIYLNLNMGKQFDEIDKILKN